MAHDPWTAEAHIPHGSADAHYRVVNNNGDILIDGIEDREVATLAASAPNLLTKLDKVATWLEGLADKCEKAAAESPFITIKEACKADARNYAATAKDIRAAIAQAEPTP